MQDHPAELNNSCLGPSDSYAGVSQSTLTRRPLSTSGQEKYDFLAQCTICADFRQKFALFWETL